MKLDPFRSYSVTSLKELGANAVAALVDVVEARADAREESYAAACARLPEAWSAVMLLAFAVERFEEGALMGDVIDALDEEVDVVFQALDEIGERELAAELRSVEESARSDDDERSDEGPPDGDVLARIRKKLAVLVASMDAPFPDADAADASMRARDPVVRDPFTAVLAEEMLQLGDAVVPTLVHVVEERAAAHAVTFAEEALHLPREWRNIVLAAAALDGMLEAQSFAGALRHVRRAVEMRELRSFFVELELDALANAFDEAQLYAGELEDGVDPSTIEEIGALLLVEEIDVGDVRRALTQAAAMVGDAFPASD
jgi:hypothetical protein